MNLLVWTTNSEEALRRLDLKPSAGEGARELFTQASQKFMQGVDEWVEFEAADRLDSDAAEGFKISSFPVDSAILAGCQNPLSLTRVDAGQLKDLEIKSVIGHNESTDAPELYFQNFDRGKVILPGKRWAFWQIADESTFEELTRPIILLSPNLAAIWRGDTLYFKSFFLASRIFDLTSHYHAATDEQLKHFASHSHFSSGNSDILDGCSNWYRKHVALVLGSGDLDKFTISQFEAAAKESDYELPVENGKIKMPEDKKKLRDLLDFLCENFYSGPFSKRRYRSRGKRNR